MKLIAAESIVLRQRDFKERDRLVTFLTRDLGKVTGIAKGVKKITSRSVGAFEPFTCCIIYFSETRGSDLVNIRKSDARPPYQYLQQDLDAFLYLTYFSELVDIGSVPRQPVPELYVLLEEMLCRVTESDRAPWSVLRLGFEMDWVRALGLAPEWRRCVGCEAPIYSREGGQLRVRRWAPHRLDIPGGGVRCPDCAAPGPGRESLAPESLAELAVWRTDRSGQAPAPGPAALAELTGCLEAHLRYHLERRPKSLELLPRQPGPRPLVAP